MLKLSLDDTECCRCHQVANRNLKNFPQRRKRFVVVPSNKETTLNYSFWFQRYFYSTLVTLLWYLTRSRRSKYKDLCHLSCSSGAPIYIYIIRNLSLFSIYVCQYISHMSVMWSKSLYINSIHCRLRFKCKFISDFYVKGRTTLMIEYEISKKSKT